jgi:hypothetical protein
MNARRGWPGRSRSALGLLLACLLLGAWLAALHPIVHLHADADHPHETGSFEKLLDSHGSAADCLVFDHLCLGDGLPAPALALPAALPAAAPGLGRWQQAWLRLVLPFQARAPPEPFILA